MFYSTARSIDNQATATTFRAAYVRYAGETEAWFDGTPQSIDGRIARANRLLHLAKESVARQGMDAEKLASIGELQADVQALTALRHDLLTAGADREDNSPIAGVHIASEWSERERIYAPDDDYDPAFDIDYNDPDWEEHFENAMKMRDELKAKGVPTTRREVREKKERERALQSGELSSAESGLTVAYREAYFRRLAAEYTETHPLNGMTVEELIELLKASVAAQASSARHGNSRTADCGDDEEYKGGEHDEDGEQPNDYLFDEQGRYRRERFKGKEAGYFGDGQDNDWRDEGYYDDETDDKRDKRGKHRMDEVGGSGRPVTNPYTGDDGGSFSGNPKGRGHWDKASRRMVAGSEWRSIECPECGSRPGDNCTEGSGHWADEGRFDRTPHELRTDPDVIAEYLEEFSPENVQRGEDQRNEGLRELADAIVRGGPREAGLSPDDRRFVVLESAKFLADNTDTDNVRELATRAQHFAQQVTSTYSDDRSQAVTTAFVRRVASAAAQRRDAVRREPSGMSRQASTVNALPPEALFL
jgi:hypothetical protein